jgi:hypothetical protein
MKICHCLCNTSGAKFLIGQTVHVQKIHVSSADIAGGALISRLRPGPLYFATLLDFLV